MRLLLFDIDGTLLRCGRQVKPIFSWALESEFGTTGDLGGYDFGGKTDPEIVLDLLVAEGFERHDVLRRLERMRTLYVPRLREKLRRDEMTLLPNVVEVLERCKQRDDIAIGLVTGNWRGGAQAKLAPFELNGYFDFGAFGDDGVDRAELPPVAIRRASQLYGREFAPADVVIVGDTVHDVRCAHANGLRVVGVGTGFTATATLEAAGADIVGESLEDPLVLHTLLAEERAELGRIGP